MKNLRRIEITTFRRRTTIVLRDRSEVGPAGPPPGDGEASPPVRADPARAAESDLDQTQTTDPVPPDSLGLIRGRDVNNRPST